MWASFFVGIFCMAPAGMLEKAVGYAIYSHAPESVYYENRGDVRFWLGMPRFQGMQNLQLMMNL